MKTLLILLIIAGGLSAADSLKVFGYRWTIPNASDWKVGQTDGSATLTLVSARGPLPGPRRPIQFALADTGDFQQVTIDADAKPLQHSLIFVFAYKDPAHFDYAHLSIDYATAQPYHNGIFHVYGGERVRISSEEGPPAFRAMGSWSHVQLMYQGKSGSVQVTIDGRQIPALHAVDLSLHSGKVGLGSFDETGEFKNVRIEGAAANLK